ncbi:MAG: hypothetical protein HC890_02985 [Chloroflexaceae bacterium]|nr:hypothetical protein [Chloroflexaceae bacterium]
MPIVADGGCCGLDGALILVRILVQALGLDRLSAKLSLRPGSFKTVTVSVTAILRRPGDKTSTIS